MAIENTDTKVVQTELPSEEYEQLRRVAETEGKSLKTALREAAREYAVSHGTLDPSDPFFAYEPPEPTGESYDAGSVDEHLYD